MVKRVATGFFNDTLSALSGIIVNYHGRILIISAVITLLISAGSIFIKIDTNQENYFPARHPVRQASDLINSKFGGSQTISVMVTGDIKSPEVMTGIDQFTNRA